MILVKIPTRQRPAKFLNTLWKYLYLAEKPEDLTFVVSLDEDDADNNKVIQEQIAKYDTPAKIHVVTGTSKSKIDAINRDIPKDGWDILLVGSDDMVPVEQGWDTTISRDMDDNFPDTDGCLWYPDGYKEKTICTMPVMGRKYYDRFGYVYHPSYHSLWCDNEATEVAQMLGKIWKSDKCIIRHEHPSNVKFEADELYKRNEGWNGRDKLTYVTRQLAGFYLSGCNGHPATRTKYSQGNEQQWIEDYFGSMVGTLLDCGANDGKTLSNSLALIERGWSALLVEPSPSAFERLYERHKNNPKVEMINEFIGTTIGSIPFFDNGTHLHNGDVALLSTGSIQEKEKWEAAGNAFTPITVQSTTFDILADHSKFKVFDFISIDAEGFDYDILTQIDLDKVGCKMLIIEHRGDVERFTDYCSKFSMKLIHKNAENICYSR